MQAALAGGGEVVQHHALPDVIMCYPAPSMLQKDSAGCDDATNVTRPASHGIPVAHEVFVTARTAEVFTRHTSHVTRHTSHITRHTSHITRHTSNVTRYAGQWSTSLPVPPADTCTFTQV